MPDDIKWIDAREFREVGFLQEANRQFFHPHGLALATTTVSDDEGAPIHTFALTAEQYERLLTLAADNVDDDDVGLLAAAKDAARYDVGDSYFQGVRDCRDDPEGVIFGSWPDRDREKSERVAAEREKHYEARCDLFGVPEGVRKYVTDPDVESIGWEAPPDVDDRPAA